MDQEILRLKDLKMYFPAGKDRFVRAVDGVDLYINKGDVLGIVGESGSGKSTIAYTVMGMYHQTDGEIIFNGETITKNSKNHSIFIYSVKYIPLFPHKILFIFQFFPDFHLIVYTFVEILTRFLPIRSVLT